MADVAIGITLPIKRGKTGYFEQSFDVIEQLKSNFVNLILTRKGERPFQPEFGSNLHELIFTQMDEEYVQNVKTAIKRDTKMWMPFLRIDNIDVVRDTDRNRTLAEVTFSLATNENVQETVVVEF